MGPRKRYEDIIEETQYDRCIEYNKTIVHSHEELMSPSKRYEEIIEETLYDSMADVHRA